VRRRFYGNAAPAAAYLSRAPPVFAAYCVRDRWFLIAPSRRPQSATSLSVTNAAKQGDRRQRAGDGDRRHRRHHRANV